MSAERMFQSVEPQHARDGGEKPRPIPTRRGHLPQFSFQGPGVQRQALAGHVLFHGVVAQHFSGRLGQEVAQGEIFQPARHGVPIRRVAQGKDLGLEGVHLLGRIFRFPFAPQQHPVHLAVEFIHEGRPPGVPRPGPRSPGIGHGQKVEEPKLGAASDLHGAPDDGFFIAQVPLQGRIGKNEVMPNEEFQQGFFYRIQPQAVGDGAAHFRPAHRMVLALPLAHIVQERRQIEDPPVRKVVKEMPTVHLRVQGRDTLFQPVHFPDGPQQMFVHGVEVIDVVLDPVADGRQFRDEGLEEARFHHDSKDGKGPGGVQEDVEEPGHRNRIGSGGVAHRPQVFPDDPPRLVVETGAALGRFPKQGHELLGAVADPFRFHEGQMVVLQEKRPRKNGLAPPKPARLLRFVAQAVQEKPGDAADAGRMAVIEVHEGFHGAAFRAVQKTQSFCEDFLIRHEEPVLALAAQVVELQPHAPQEILRLFQPEGLFGGKPARVREGRNRRRPEEDDADPADGVDVPKTPDAFLEVRFQKIAAFAVAAVAALSIVAQVFQKPGALASCEFPDETVAPPAVKVRIAAGRSRFHVGGLDAEVLAHELLQILGGGDHVAHFEPGVPQGGDHPTDGGFQGWRKPPLVEEDQVQVGSEAQLPAAESATAAAHQPSPADPASAVMSRRSSSRSRSA